MVGDEPGDERDFLQYVILVRAGQLGHMDVGVVDPDSEALPEKALDDVDNRADRKSTRLNSSHLGISYAVFCLKKNILHILLLFHKLLHEISQIGGGAV